MNETIPPEISIIVPVYNVEPYLHKCVDSILAQRFTRFELLLVDDGSTDRSGAICDEYAQQDSRVRVFHQSNSGQSTARNVGLREMRGSYVGFIDSDDYILPEMYQSLYDELIAADADVVECNFSKVDAQGKVLATGDIPVKEMGEGEYLLDRYTHRQLFNGVVTRLFKRKIVESIGFVPGRQMEDTCFTMDLMAAKPKIVLLPTVFYFYLIREGSTLHSPFTEKKVDDIYHQQLYQLQVIRQTPMDGKRKQRIQEKIKRERFRDYCSIALFANISNKRTVLKKMWQGLDLSLIELSQLPGLKTSLKLYGLLTYFGQEKIALALRKRLK